MATEPIDVTETEPTRVTVPRVVNVAIVGTFLILFAGVLYYARGFFLPLILLLHLKHNVLPRHSPCCNWYRLALSILRKQPSVCLKHRNRKALNFS